MSMRMVGMLIAGVLMGAVLALIGLAYLTAPPKTVPNTPAPSPRTIIDPDTPGTQPSPQTGEDAETTEPPEPVDLTGDPRDMGQMLGQGDRTTYRSVNERGELQSIVRAGKFDPRGRGLYELNEVTVSFFADDRVIRLLAKKGEIRGTWGQRPDSGLLSGDVSLSMYPAGTTEDDAIAHERGEGGIAPELRFTTNAMRFDMTLGQGIAEGQVTINAQGARLDGRGLTVRFGTRADSDTPLLLLVRLDESDGLQLWPDRLATTDNKGDVGKSSSDSTAADNSKGNTPADIADSDGEIPPTLYQFNMQGDVVISRENYAARADTLDVYARLFDGALRAGAIAPIRTQKASESQNAGTRGNEPRVDEGADPTLDPPIIVTWNGPLEFSPILQPPGLLDFDDVAVRFSSEEEGGVRMGDDLAHARLEARTVTYFATGAIFEARSGKPEGVALRADGVAELVCSGLDLDLSASPIVQAITRTPGSAADAAGSQVRWGRGASLTGELGEDRFIPTDFSLAGDVRLDSDSGENAIAEQLAVGFDDAGNPSVIHASGRVRAENTQQQRSVAGDAMTLQLTPVENGGFALTSALVEGNASAHDGETDFSGATLAAEFKDGKVTTVAAQQNVRVQLENGLSVACDSARSDRATGTTDLIGRDGEPVRVTRAADGITLTTEVGSARIEDARGRVTGFGPGTGTLVADPGASAQYQNADLDWGGGFVFDRESQRLDLLGGVNVVAKKNDSERHSAKADRAEIDFEGIDSGAARVIGARLFSGVDDEGSEQPARAEARRTRIDPDSETGRTLESLLEIKSGELLVDVDAQTVDAPGAGRLIIEDRREENKNNTEEDRADSRGTSVFDWSGAMLLKLDEGTAAIDQDVRVRHLPVDTDSVTQLDCQRLDAFFLADQGEDTGFSLRRIEARESVFAGYKGLELLADALVYKAMTEQIVATATGNNRVTVFDPNRDGHYTAAEVVIDLVTGNWTSTRATGGGGAP